MSETPAPATTVDRDGVPVAVGTIVRILSIRPSVLERLDDQEADRVKSMLGAELEVYEIDAWGGAWVEKWSHESEDRATSHSLALSPSEMEVVRL